MAHKKVTSSPALLDWSAVDTTLRDIRECRHSLTEMDVEKSRAIDDIKDRYGKMALPLQNRIKRLEADVKEYVSAHREELNGKSKQLNFGTVGYRISSSIVASTSKLGDIIAKLKAMGHSECVKVTETLDKKALGRCSADVILAVGAYVKQTDDFYYDLEEDSLADISAAQ